MSPPFSTQPEPTIYYGLSTKYQDQYEYLQNMKKYNLEKQCPKLKANDLLNFHINVLSRSDDSNSVTHLNTLLHNYQEVSSKRFSQEGEDWIQSILFHLEISSKSVEGLAKRIVHEVHELFDFNQVIDSDLANGVGDCVSHRFTLHLRIVIENN
ncbi:uncharacterized protein LOC131647933 [Vicia villosa]|uniref:uncharacterized protein LOC131647933 n=1 Tax=Vicia villosa TaxID=3911 RepID=UPI00273AEE5E|nr:uncharacterized protein LOC131647933 [Vicia villosa]